MKSELERTFLIFKTSTVCRLVKQARLLHSQGFKTSYCYHHVELVP